MRGCVEKSQPKISRKKSPFIFKCGKMAAFLQPPVKLDRSYHAVCAKKIKLQKNSSCHQVIAVCTNLGILGRARLLIVRPGCLLRRNSVQPTVEFNVSRQNLLDERQDRVGSGQFSLTKLSGYHICTELSSLDYSEVVISPYGQITFFSPDHLAKDIWALY